MSTLKVNNVTDLGDDAIVTAGALVGAGKILQVVHVVKTDPQTASLTTGASVAISGFAPSITPISDTSKLIHFCNLGASTTYSYHFEVTGGVSIAVGDAAGSRSRAVVGQSATSDFAGKNSTFTFVDTPGATTTLTYGMTLTNASSDTRPLLVNVGNIDTDAVRAARTTSTWVIMEVSA